MIWDTALDSGAEFTDVTGSGTALKSGGEYYHVTTGVRVGFWRINNGISSSFIFDSSAISEVNNVLININGIPLATRWAGNGFGDDNNFNIVSGESTVLDDNGNAVIVGQKRVALPFFTGKAS